MLIIANGAFKSGSTWQRDILRNIIAYEDLPEKYRDARVNTFLDVANLDEFISSGDIKEKNFIAKSHFYKKKTVAKLVNKPNVYVFNIKRDIKDSIVSHYFHFIKQRNKKTSFKRYYWLIGRYKAIQMIKYSKNWNIAANNVLHSTFEDLKRNFENEVLKYGNFIGIELSDDDLQRIKSETDIKKIKEKSNRKWFFRKGDIGDYKNHFTQAILKDIERLSEKPSMISKLSYFMIFEIRLELRSFLNRFRK